MGIGFTFSTGTCSSCGAVAERMRSVFLNSTTDYQACVNEDCSFFYVDTTKGGKTSRFPDSTLPAPCCPSNAADRKAAMAHLKSETLNDIYITKRRMAWVESVRKRYSQLKRHQQIMCCVLWYSFEASLVILVLWIFYLLFQFART